MGCERAAARPATSSASDAGVYLGCLRVAGRVARHDLGVALARPIHQLVVRERDSEGERGQEGVLIDPQA
jgi:hypothetical protein